MEIIEILPDSNISSSSMLTDLRIIRDFIIEEILEVFGHWEHKLEKLVMKLVSLVPSSRAKRGDPVSLSFRACPGILFSGLLRSSRVTETNGANHFLPSYHICEEFMREKRVSPSLG
jgi:hypothetical protein